jgi:hypothetical protein
MSKLTLNKHPIQLPASERKAAVSRERLADSLKLRTLLDKLNISDDNRSFALDIEKKR